MIVYGIPNCNTVKKAMTWLSENGFKAEFHDFKKKGITPEKLNEWCEFFGWEKVLNKQGTTWKKLDLKEQKAVVNKESAIYVLLNHTSAIKRPVVEVSGKAVLIGFTETAYSELKSHLL
ncbi:arsenate reductase [Pedobacter psychroterrae]|uniref:Arsenate reductase n=1 Tax=Pedobacter psychroterrae TaxID=2530453 RepID=A0A4R0NR86_9SPHI|nr:arsenate reductase [Pedobacter psychroterrae]TCD03632.1 arsenate reductase [Pedobacter psychroterrae]